MKKYLVLILLVVSSLGCHADEYNYLTFETTDGNLVSVPASQLTLNFNGTTLTVGSETFELSNLVKMYFTVDDVTTGITTITAEAQEEITAVYDLQGKQVPKDKMQHGVYIVKTPKGVFKILAK